ncbi:PREDICTED: uncharacterized protein C10orf131 homolog [Condylura cristata]|uniref:uncharacterized protein C10orf131 homolog n=1 Tax=Condylura cristata TaxID=143302 RepID=UPI0003343457|nr:PREDICTED: uncharacterized protein C10orf131 homolog [Condylura cristata]
MAHRQRAPEYPPSGTGAPVAAPIAASRGGAGGPYAPVGTTALPHFEYSGLVSSRPAPGQLRPPGAAHARRDAGRSKSRGCFHLRSTRMSEERDNTAVKENLDKHLQKGSYYVVRKYHELYIVSFLVDLGAEENQSVKETLRDKVRDKLKNAKINQSEKSSTKVFSDKVTHRSKVSPQPEVVLDEGLSFFILSSEEDAALGQSSEQRSVNDSYPKHFSLGDSSQNFTEGQDEDFMKEVIFPDLLEVKAAEYEDNQEQIKKQQANIFEPSSSPVKSDPEASTRSKIEGQREMYQLDLNIVGLQFSHHPLFNQEQVLCARLLQLYERFQDRQQQNLPQLLYEKLKALIDTTKLANENLEMNQLIRKSLQDYYWQIRIKTGTCDEQKQELSGMSETEKKTKGKTSQNGEKQEYMKHKEEYIPKYFRLEQLQDEFNFVSEEEMKKSKRFQLLQLRNAGLFDVVLQPIPLYDREIPDSIFQMRKLIMKRIVKVSKFNLADIVADYEEIVSTSQLTHAVYKLVERRRMLKPQRKERKKVAAQTICDGDIKILVRILRAYNIPTRKIEVARCAAATTNCTVFRHWPLSVPEVEPWRTQNTGSV